MNMNPPLPMKTLGGKGFKESKIPEPYCYPLPVLPDPIEEVPNSPAPYPASASWGMMANSLQIHNNMMISYNGQSNNYSPFLLGFPANLHLNSFPFGEGPSQNPEFISMPLGTEPHFRPNHDVCLGIQSLPGYVDYRKEDDDNGWSNSPIQGVLNFPEGIPLPSGPLGTTVDVVSNENGTKEVDWKTMAEDLHPGSRQQSNWNEFLPDPNVQNQPPEVPQSSSDITMHLPQSQQQLCLPFRELPAAANPSTHTELSSDIIMHQPQAQQQLFLPSGEELAMGNPPTSSQSNKSRMRWTPELHEAFLDVVNKLGGGEKATPKVILTHMNVEGLSIQHIKSHLQKYRSAKVRPEASEGNSEKRPTTTEHVSSIDLKTSVSPTEALRIQMEVQKQLHEQLEIQRKLQLKIEEQGRYLLQMLEKQKKVEQQKQSPLPNTSANPNNTEAFEVDQLQEGLNGSGNGSGSGDMDFEADGPCPPLSKRAKQDDSVH